MVDIAHVCARIHAKQGQTRANFWRRHDTKSFDQISVNNELFNNSELTWSDRRIMWSVWDFLNVSFWQLANNILSSFYTDVVAARLLVFTVRIPSISISLENSFRLNWLTLVLASTRWDEKRQNCAADRLPL